jgi:hypothetical protein
MYLWWLKNDLQWTVHHVALLQISILLLYCLLSPTRVAQIMILNIFSLWIARFLLDKPESHRRMFWFMETAAYRCHKSTKAHTVTANKGRTDCKAENKELFFFFWGTKSLTATGICFCIHSGSAADSTQTISLTVSTIPLVQVRILVSTLITMLVRGCGPQRHGY